MRQIHLSGKEVASDLLLEKRLGTFGVWDYQNELYLKFSNSLRMLGNTHNTKILKFQLFWNKTTNIFDTSEYCMDWMLNTVFKVLKHLFLKLFLDPCRSSQLLSLLQLN